MAGTLDDDLRGAWPWRGWGALQSGLNVQDKAVSAPHCRRGGSLLGFALETGQLRSRLREELNQSASH